jgi:transcription-repair coupling factor (superfamily II helicase)
MPMEIGGQPGEFLVLEYQDGDRIYVPVQQLHLVSRYTGAAPENAPLHKLGTDQWARARKRAADQIRDVAAELLDLYARRKAQQGLSLPANEHDYQAFASTFPFEETADQAEAIRQVLVDLASARPMDRIAAMGFGKTEVAMRRLVAAQAGKQVAVLAPTAAGAAAPGELPRPLRRLAAACGRPVALWRSKETLAVLRASSRARSTS